MPTLLLAKRNTRHQPAYSVPAYYSLLYNRNYYYARIQHQKYSECADRISRELLPVQVPEVRARWPEQRCLSSARMRKIVGVLLRRMHGGHNWFYWRYITMLVEIEWDEWP